MALRSSTLTATVEARKVFLVLGSRSRRPRRLQVLLDGRPIRDSRAGADVHRASVVVRRQRLYSLVSLPSVARTRLTLRVRPRYLALHLRLSSCARPFRGGPLAQGWVMAPSCWARARPATAIATGVNRDDAARRDAASPTRSQTVNARA